MADALVSVVLGQLTSILGIELRAELQLLKGVEKEIQKLKTDFEAISKVLDDAENRSLKENEVEIWVDELKQVCYDMEDVLDEWRTATMLKLQLQPAKSASKLKNKVRSWISSHLPWIRRPVWNLKIAHEIKNIKQRVGEVLNRTKDFNFKLTTGATATELERQKTTSFGVLDIRGRGCDKERLINRLLSESSQQEKHSLSAIAIVGMGGIGKTTLAQVAYNDENVKTHFDIRIWVCVSNPFNVTSIARAILEGLGFRDGALNLTELESSLQEISKAIDNQKFLLVLDDVWNEDKKKWEPLRNCLTNGARGSKILVTTRSEGVAKIVEAPNPICLGELSDEECWSIFSETAFSGRSEEECEYLKEIGWKIMERCKGLPLAAKVLGGLMCSKRSSAVEWQKVLDSDLWALEEANKELDPVFMLSYYDLPSAMKRCFAYCAIFPEDHAIRRDGLIHLWMANGLLGGSEVEETGENYIEILAMRSLFQDLERDDTGRTEYCKMHDLVRKFALRVNRNECGAIEVYKGEEELMMKQEQPAYAKLRHARLTFQGDHSPSALSQFRIKGLRTLMSPTELKAPDGEMKLLGGLICGLTRLRALDLSWLEMKVLPADIGKLMHLRYLGLDWNRYLEALPETVCDLCNLQTLIISHCRRIERLPTGIGKLLNLRHLDFDLTNIKKLPKGIEELTSLRTLQGAVFVNPYKNKKGDDNDAEECFGIGDFEKLHCLGGRLILENLGDLELSDVGEAKRARLKSKKNLRRLYLVFHGSSSSKEEEEEERAKRQLLIAEALEPPPYLEELRLYHYRGAELPSWITLLSGLKVLALVHCPNLKELPGDFFERLPPLLHQVKIYYCPTLMEYCHRRIMEDRALASLFRFIC